MKPKRNCSNCRNQAPAATQAGEILLPIVNVAYMCDPLPTSYIYKFKHVATQYFRTRRSTPSPNTTFLVLAILKLFSYREPGRSTSPGGWRRSPRNSGCRRLRREVVPRSPTPQTCMNDFRLNTGLQTIRGNNGRRCTQSKIWHSQWNQQWQ